VTLVHTPQLELFDDGPIKAAAIWNVVGRRPILAARGASTGEARTGRQTGTWGPRYVR